VGEIKTQQTTQDAAIDAEYTRATAAEASLQTEIDANQQGIDSLKDNPTGLSSISTPYFPGWYITSLTSTAIADTTSEEGIAEVSAAALVRWAFTRSDSLDITKYNYVISYKVYSSNTNFELCTGFCTKAVENNHQAGNSYFSSGGTWSPNLINTNNFGEAIEFRLTPSFTLLRDLIATSTSTTSVDVSGATDALPYEMKVTIQDGYISKMEAIYNGAVLSEFIADESWSAPLPKGPLHMYLIDTNNGASGSSSWKVGISILERSIRSGSGASYNLQNVVQPYPSGKTTVSDVTQRFIPYGAQVVELQSHSGSTYIDPDIYFLPTAKYVGERIFLYNTSNANITVYDTLPEDPSISTSTWTSWTIPHGTSQDHAEFVATSIHSWHQIL
jgi:hypothetical protein